ncbi:hypothetical protein ACC763_38685, partial [Rhizobium ruizarguesonis]
QNGVLDHSLQSLIDSVVHSSTAAAIHESFATLGSNTQNLLRLKEAQFGLKGERTRMIADARAASDVCFALRSRSCSASLL